MSSSIDSGVKGQAAPSSFGSPPPAAAGGQVGSVLSPTLGSSSATRGTESATYPAQSLAALETYKKKDASKVVVRFKAIGNAPIMKNNYFRITAFNRFQAVIQFLRKELGWKQGDALVSDVIWRPECDRADDKEDVSLFQYLYINSSFSPAPDDTVGNLYRCFGTEGHLIVNYSTQAAWG